jgi:hypothetical protein
VRDGAPEQLESSVAAGPAQRQPKPAPAMPKVDMDRVMRVAAARAGARLEE